MLCWCIDAVFSLAANFIFDHDFSWKTHWQNTLLPTREFVCARLACLPFEMQTHRMLHRIRCLLYSWCRSRWCWLAIVLFSVMVVGRLYVHVSMHLMLKCKVLKHLKYKISKAFPATPLCIFIKPQHSIAHIEYALQFARPRAGMPLALPLKTESTRCRCRCRHLVVVVVEWMAQPHNEKYT